VKALHFVAAVRWEANYENSGRCVAAHFLVPHSLNSCLHPFGDPFFSSIICNFMQPRRNNSQSNGFLIGKPHIRLFRPPHNRLREVLEKMGE
jgi:hypothetical protein